MCFYRIFNYMYFPSVNNLFLCFTHFSLFLDNFNFPTILRHLYILLTLTHYWSLELHFIFSKSQFVSWRCLMRFAPLFKFFVIIIKATFFFLSRTAVRSEREFLIVSYSASSPFPHWCKLLLLHLVCALLVQLLHLRPHLSTSLSLDLTGL